MPEYTAARRRLDHATFRERADASDRCTGLEVKLYMPTSDKARAWYACSIMADLFFGGGHRIDGWDRLFSKIY
jgi:hypothetical protein